MPTLSQPRPSASAFHGEGLAVGAARGAHHAVLRQLHFAALQPFLQGGLGIFRATACMWG